MPLPGAFGSVFGFWLKDRPKGDDVFARAGRKRYRGNRQGPICAGC